MTCENANHIHAYHDGELSSDQRDAVESHLLECAECAELLNDLRSLSRLFAAAPMTEISPLSVQRLRSHRYVLPDAGVLRIAGWLTAAAAAVLLAALPVWHQQHDETPAVASADILDTVAVMPSPDPEGGRNDLIALAQWMADDLSAGERH